MKVQDKRNLNDVVPTRNGKRVQFSDADDLIQKFRTRNGQMKYSLFVLDPINQSINGRRQSFDPSIDRLVHRLID